MVNKNISKLDDMNSDDELDDQINEDDLKENIFNFNLDNKTRVKVFNTYYEKYGDDILEIINKLNGMYLVSGTTLLHNFIEVICKESTISDVLKIESAKCLCIQNDIQENYAILEYVIKHITEISVPCHVDGIVFLMQCDKFRETCNEEFCKIIDNIKFDCDYRYKTILSLEHKLSDKEKLTYYTLNSTFIFIQNQHNYTTYRILGCQLLLQCYELDDSQKEICENLLSVFMKDEDLAYNLRADAADVLLKLGNESNKQKAQEVIMILARRDGDVNTFFDDAENVHHHEIEESAIETLEFLQNQYNKVMLSIVDVETGIFKFWEEYNVKNSVKEINETEEYTFQNLVSINNLHFDKFMEKCDLIKIAINRIKMDRALYSKFNCQLSHILIQVWQYVIDNKHKDEMKKRMIEELVDMAGKCSTGYAFRLINVLSGFGDFTIRISWLDQLSGSLAGRMNAYIRSLHDKEYQMNILNEMIVKEDNENLNLHGRENFFRFLRETLPFIRQELWNEYRDHITDTDFDVYFKRAMSKYEGYNIE